VDSGATWRRRCAFWSEGTAPRQGLSRDALNTRRARSPSLRDPDKCNR